MRRHFQYAAPVVDTPLQLSAEEQAIAADEASEKAIEVAATTQEIETLGDIIVTMGEAQTVVSNIPEIKPIDQALISSVADAAVAGTDADPEELAGSLLPDEGVSTESLTVKLKGRLAEMKDKVAAFQAAK